MFSPASLNILLVQLKKSNSAPHAPKDGSPLLTREAASPRLFLAGEKQYQVS